MASVDTAIAPMINRVKSWTSVGSAAGIQAAGSSPQAITSANGIQFLLLLLRLHLVV